MKIHPTAIVHPEARLGEGTTVGAYSIIDPRVRTGVDCTISDHAIIRSGVTLGDKVRVFSGAVLGEEPQHLKYAGEPTVAEIGDRVVIREFVTVHRGTPFGGGKTVVKDDAYLMAYAHVAHDCVVGTGTVIVNSVQIGGHVQIGDYVTVGGQSAIAQYVRIGDHCYLGGGSVLRKDMPPFVLGKGWDFAVQGINLVGLSRRGFSPETLQSLKKIYRIFYMQNLQVKEAVEKIIAEFGTLPEAQKFVEFVSSSKLGFVR